MSGLMRMETLVLFTDISGETGLMEMEARGLAVPADIGVAGFNDLRLNGVLNSRITTSRTPRRLMGEIGARRLLARINGVTDEPVAALPLSIEPGDTTVGQQP